MLVSCNKEIAQEESTDQVVKTSFAVSVSNKAATKAEIGDGTAATKLNVAVYGTGDKYLPELSLVGDKAVQMSNLTAEVTLSLVKGLDYKVAFFAQNPQAESYTLDFENATLIADIKGLANDEARDAFFGCAEIINLADGFYENVILVRPFSQVNVLTPASDLAAFVAQGGVFTNSQMTITDLPNKMSLLDGTVDETTLSTYTFISNKMADASFTPAVETGEAITYKYISSNYVLTPAQTSLHTVTFSVNDGQIEFPAIANVPLAPNFRTNIIGNVFTADATFYVNLDSEMNGDLDFNKKVPNLAFTVESASVKVGETLKLTVTKDEASTQTVKFNSLDTDILTVDAEGTIKGIAPGTTQVMAYVEDDGTFLDDFVFLDVTVTSDKKDPGISIAEPTGGLEVGGTLNLSVTIDETSTQVISFTSSNERVATVSADGVVSGVAEGTVTITASVEEDDDFLAGSDAIEITVAAATAAPTSITLMELRKFMPTETSKTELPEPKTVNDVTVSYVNGSTFFIEDATGGMMVYKSGHGFTAGTVLKNLVVKEGQIYNSVPEITDYECESVAGQTVPLTELTVAELTGNFDKYQSMRVKVSNVSFTADVSGTRKTATVSQGNDNVNAYILPNSNFKQGTTANITGAVTMFSNAVQLTVAAIEDIEVISVPAYITLSKTNVNAQWDDTSVTLTVTSNVDWTASSLENGVTVSPASGTGDETPTEVTVTFGENTHNVNGGNPRSIMISFEGEGAIETLTIEQNAPQNIDEPTDGDTQTGGVDVLDRALTEVTGTNYAAWSGKTAANDGHSNAVYAGQSAGGNESIQLRSNNSTSGVVTTATGGKVKKVVVTWNANTAQERTLNIYGKSTAYEDPTELYSADKQGTLLGTIVYGTSTVLTVEGDYEFIGFRSNSGAMYLEKVEITWE